MILRDKTGGIFARIFLNKENPEIVIRDAYRPNARGMRLIGSEAISSVRGSTKHTFSTKRVNGKLVITKTVSGSYPFGILKRISPDGTPYEQLADSTMRIRKAVKEINRGREYILRETSEHIYQGLRILAVEQQSGRTVYPFRLSIGWEGVDKQIAELQNAGGEALNPIFFLPSFKNSSGMLTEYNVEIPARPFIGFQKAFIDNMYRLVKQIAKVG